MVEPSSFWNPVWWKRLQLVPIQPVCQTVGELDGFLYEAAQSFEVFSNIQY
jgi:hypothetical protein